MSSSLAPFLEEAVIYWLRHVILWSIAWDTGYDLPRNLAELFLGSFEGHFPIRVLRWEYSCTFGSGNKSRVSATFLSFLFLSIFLGDFHKQARCVAWGCCVPSFYCKPWQGGRSPPPPGRQTSESGRRQRGWLQESFGISWSPPQRGLPIPFWFFISNINVVNLKQYMDPLF